MADRLVTFEQDGVIGIVTLRRPEKFNALDIPMLRALEAALDAAEDADGVRVVLVCGEGKGFCAGGDVEAWSALSAADFQVKWVRYGHRVFDRLARLRQPTIAVLSGHALGGGLELAAACRLPRRRAPSEARLSRDVDRRRARLVGHAARGAPLRRADRAAAGARRRDPARARQRWRSASSTVWWRRARRSPRRRPGPERSPSAGRSPPKPPS